MLYWHVRIIQFYPGINFTSHINISILQIDSLNHIVYQSLQLSDHDLAGTVNDKCLYCESPLEVLKKSALEVVRTQFNPFLRNMIPYNNETTPNSSKNITTNSSNSPEQHAMLDRAYTTATRGETTDSHNGYRVPGKKKNNEWLYLWQSLFEILLAVNLFFLLLIKDVFSYILKQFKDLIR